MKSERDVVQQRVIDMEERMQRQTKHIVASFTTQIQNSFTKILNQ